MLRWFANTMMALLIRGEGRANLFGWQTTLVPLVCRPLVPVRFKSKTVLVISSLTEFQLFHFRTSVTEAVILCSRESMSCQDLPA